VRRIERGSSRPPARDQNSNHRSESSRGEDGAITIGSGPPEAGVTGGATGIVESGLGWAWSLGGHRSESDNVKSLALLFGTFDACAGRTYTFRFTSGSRFARVLQAAPVITIDVHHTLEGDGRIHDDGPRLSLACHAEQRKGDR